MLPGFVNGHHHVGLTPVQLGSPDLPLELWLTTKMIARKVSLYLDTLYSAFEMIASGVTTVQHIHGVSPGGLQEASDASDEVIRAYDDIGMRTSFSFMLRDQNRLVHQQDEAFAASLPEALQAPMRRWFGRYKMDLNDNIALFEGLHGRYGGKPRTRIQLAPATLHWCSDTALARLSDVARKYDVPLHMHLAETPLQKEYARRRGGGRTPSAAASRPGAYAGGRHICARRPRAARGLCRSTSGGWPAPAESASWACRHTAHGGPRRGRYCRSGPSCSARTIGASAPVAPRAGWLRRPRPAGGPGDSDP